MDEIGAGYSQSCKDEIGDGELDAGKDKRLTFITRGKHLSYQRGKRNTNPNTSLIKIEGVDDPKAAR